MVSICNVASRKHENLNKTTSIKIENKLYNLYHQSSKLLKMTSENTNNNHRNYHTLYAIISIIIGILVFGAMLFVIIYVVYINNDDYCDTSNQMQSLKNDLVFICNNPTCLRNTTTEKIEHWCSYIMLMAENMKI